MARTKTSRHPLVQQNLLDKVIAYVAPKVAQQRMMARAQLALVGGYSGARRDKAQTLNWNPGSGSPTTDAVMDLPMLRDRSRDEMRNSGVASGALNGAVTGIVGTGLSAMPSVDYEALGMTLEEGKAWNSNTRRRFEMWAGCEDCDIARTSDFYGLQQLAKRAWLESGDAFIITPRIARSGRPAQLALQLLEGDRVCNPARTANTPTLIEGVEVSAETSEAIAYHIARHHPGDLFSGGNSWTRVIARGDSTGRRNVLHLFNPLRPGQVRGVPWISPILEPLKQLDRWTENELNAAVTSSIFSVFAKMDAQAFQDIFDEDGESQQLIQDRSKWTGALDSGKVVNLLPGEELGSVSSTRPNPLFDPFWQAMVRQIGMALEVPYEVLCMHFQSSYSAARGALLMAWKFYKGRRDMLAKKMCQPVYELWLADEVAAGRISAPGYFASEFTRAAWNRCLWTGDGPGSIDPGKEVDAAAKRVELGISTLEAESVLHDGVDWETKHRQRVIEVNAQKADGIYIPPAGSPAPAPDPNAPANDGGDGAPPPDGSVARKLQQLGASIDSQRIDAAHATGRMEAMVASALSASAGTPSSASMVAVPAIHIHQAPVHVTSPDVHVTVPETTVNVEATMPVPSVEIHQVAAAAPAVHVTNAITATAAPAQVVMNHPAGTIATHVRDPKTQEIVRTETQFIASEKS